MFTDVESDSTFATGHDKSARNYVKFYRQWIRNNFKSEQDGIEVGEHYDYIIIVCPGAPKSEVRRKASEQDKQEYRAEWNAYLQGKEHQASGTPVELLPNMPHGMSDMLKSLYIFSIEQLAALSDINLQKLGMGGNELREKAKQFLEKSTNDVAKLKKENEMLRAELLEKDALIEQLSRKKRVA